MEKTTFLQLSHLRKRNLRAFGVTIIELLIILSILSILILVALPNIVNFYKIYKYNQYLIEVESTLKWARMWAIESGNNTGICITNTEPNTLRIYNLGSNRSSICVGEILRRIKINEDFIALDATDGGTAFDSRGLAIFPTTITIRLLGNSELCVKFTTVPLRGLIEKREC